MPIQDWAFRKEYYWKVTSLGIMTDRPLTLSLYIAINILLPINKFIVFYIETYKF